MSVKRVRIWPKGAGNNQKRKLKPNARKCSEVVLVCTTTWFNRRENLSSSCEDVSVYLERSSTGKEHEEVVGGGLRRQPRAFGSAGNILDTMSENLRRTKTHLGKSLQQLPTGSISNNSKLGSFRVETGLDCRRGGRQLCSLPALSLHEHALLENPESETRWYFRYFLGKYHTNYLCYDLDKCPLFLSIVPSDAIYRCIIWKRTGNKRLCVKNDSKGKWPSPKSILEKSSIKVDRNFKEIHSASVQKDLLTLEEQEGSVSFKFGVLYTRAGQKTDDAMYCNECGSDRFSQFLELLGDEVQLRGWEQFRGGLDCKNDSTGLSSVHTLFEGHEIMFHVSTLLPYTAGNQQQLERKRHIGNDIVVIIFVDYDTNPEDAYKSIIMDFDPSYMRSHFNHIFALVSYNHVTETYHLVVYSAESVPVFGPPLPYNGEFTNFVAFRDFLLTKLINGEKAAYCTPTFSEKRERTLGLLLKGFEEDYNHEMRRATSTPTLNLSPLTFKKFNEREQIFTEYGQRLKVEKIITGNHPTSQRTTVAPKREPWETECVAESFPYKIRHGDLYDEGTFVVTTPNEGTYFIYRDGGYSQLMDQSINVGQLVVAHRHHILLFRTNYTKEANYIFAIPLEDIFTKGDRLTKQTLCKYQLPHSKNVSLFCTSPLNDQFLRLAVAVKTKVYMLAYKHPASMVLNGSPVTPDISCLPKDTFIKHRELSLPDVPAHMSLLDERPSGKLCVAYQKLMVVDVIDEIKATTQKIHNVDISKNKLTTLTGVQSSGQSELLIGYNLTCQLIRLYDNSSSDPVKIVWNTEPRELVYLHPYMLAFTAHSVEIRMASNGSLMQTINVPDLQLISSKGDIYFASSSSMVHSGTNSSTASKTPITFTLSFSQPNSRLPKNMDKKDFVASGKFGDSGMDMTYIYKIDMESMTGRRDIDMAALGSSISLRNSSSDDSISRTEVVSIVSSDDCTSDGSMLDYIHPMMKDDVPTSFDEDESPLTFCSPKNHHPHQYHQQQSRDSSNYHHRQQSRESPNPYQRQSRELSSHHHQQSRESPNSYQRQSRELSSHHYQQSRESPNSYQRQSRELSSHHHQQNSESPNLHQRQSSELSSQHHQQNSESPNLHQRQSSELSSYHHQQQSRESPNPYQRQSRELSSNHHQQNSESPNLHQRQSSELSSQHHQQNSESTNLHQRQSRELSSHHRQHSGESPSLNQHHNRQFSNPYQHQSRELPNPYQHQSRELPNPYQQQSRELPNPHQHQSRELPNPYQHQSRELPNPYQQQSRELPNPHQHQSRELPNPHQHQSRELPNSHQHQSRELPNPYQHQSRELPNPYQQQSRELPNPHQHQSKELPNPYQHQSRELPDPYQQQSRELPNPHQHQSRELPNPYQQQSRELPNHYQQQSLELPSSYPNRETFHSHNHISSATHRAVEARSNSFGPSSSAASSSNSSLQIHPLPTNPVNVSRLSPPCSSNQSQMKLQRARKVMTSRNSLESGSRWLQPSPGYIEGSKANARGGGDQVGGVEVTGKYGQNLAEMLGANDIPCSSPDSGVHDDFYIDSNSNSALVERNAPH